LVARDAVVLSGVPVLTVHDKMEWIAAASLLEYQLAPADIPIAEELMQI
jgi:8-oxo-dGTP diphosphatase